MKKKGSFSTTLLTLMMLSATETVYPITTETITNQNGVKTKTVKEFKAVLLDNHEYVGYAIMVIGLIICAMAAFTWYKRTHQKPKAETAFKIEGKVEKGVKLNASGTFEIALAVIGGILILAGLIFARLTLSFGAIF